MIPVRIKLKPGAVIPGYQTGGSAGADLCAFVEMPVVLQPGSTVLVPTGVFIEIPEGYEAQVRPRSGLALKHGITLTNAPGTIDSDYRGEIKIIMTNLGRDVFTVENGMRIAQLVFAKVYRGEFLETDRLNETARNEGGFGHSGI
ncbi:MAG TPA: dUTP diphosphatase [Spirochaetota bacterium]|nr:dUTP diphosphatase [Spirochaetota bacterium]